MLVDMNGYTQHARPELFAAAPARVCVSLLGFAASLQAPWLHALTTGAPPPSLPPPPALVGRPFSRAPVSGPAGCGGPSGDSLP